MLNVKQSRINSLAKIVAEQAITYATEKQKILSPSGNNQRWLIDLRPVLLDVDSLNLITDMFWDEFEDRLPFQIGGMEVAAVPLVTALLMKAEQRGLKTNGFVIRKERKICRTL